MPAIAQAPIGVTWRGAEHPATELQGKGIAEAAAAWAELARTTGGRLVLSDDQRVLLVLSRSFARRTPAKEPRELEEVLELLRKTSAHTDSFTAPADPAAPPVVLLGVRSADYPAVLRHLAALDPRLAPWTESAAGQACGFVLADPLVAAWIEDPEGVEEWHPHNELVHRTAQLLIHRGTPHLPPWLTIGLAWHVEDSVRASIYCFPHRAGFVSAGAHTDWGLWLASAFKPDRRKKAGLPAQLGIDEFATWQPRQEDGFGSGKAYVAFGVARFLAQRHAAELPGLLRQLHERTVAGSKVWTSDTTWTTDPAWQVPAGEQQARLESLDAGILREITRFFVERRANKPTVLGRGGS